MPRNEEVVYNHLNVTFVFANEAFVHTIKGDPHALREMLITAMETGKVVECTLIDGRQLVVDMRRIGMLVL